MNVYIYIFIYLYPQPIFPSNHFISPLRLKSMTPCIRADVVCKPSHPDPTPTFHLTFMGVHPNYHMVMVYSPYMTRFYIQVASGMVVQFH